MKTILIIDDESKICVLLAQFFRGRGFRTMTAQSGAEAIKQLSREAPDYLLVDIRMPDLSGLEVLKLAKRLYPHIQAVVVTAIEDQETAEEAFRLGACDYVTKPLGLNDRDWARAFFAAER